MKNELKRLIEFTEGCREDMHEPDEQGLSARVVGNYLNNAIGIRIESLAIPEKDQEYIVILEKDDTIELFNLATLIALARKANL